ncbi:NAD(P)-dependent oxidoreductase [Telluribacter sp.]|jgi:putative NADH-flavin reductase|uniref:NAD(P)-dependent oxidoreductase n=1 Tax=Telluribacter sp. TaxID=1978767 RepID=UPI002E1419DB|nr:NAD(P)H-binding protein [Telluribacter sp.]
MNQTTTIALLGGGGKTGTYLVNELLSRGYSLKLLLRKPENFTLQSTAIQICQGDALDYEDICRLVTGCQAVVSTLGQRPGEPLVASQATTHLLKAMQDQQIMRYILVAGLNLDTPTDKKGAQTRMATDWMKSTFPAIHEDRQRAYSILQQSRINWTR